MKECSERGKVHARRTLERKTVNGVLCGWHKKRDSLFGIDIRRKMSQKEYFTINEKPCKISREQVISRMTTIAHYHSKQKISHWEKSYAIVQLLSDVSGEEPWDVVISEDKAQMLELRKERKGRDVEWLLPEFRMNAVGVRGELTKQLKEVYDSVGEEYVKSGGKWWPPYDEVSKAFGRISKFFYYMYYLHPEMEKKDLFEKAVGIGMGIKTKDTTEFFKKYTEELKGWIGAVDGISKLIEEEIDGIRMVTVFTDEGQALEKLSEMAKGFPKRIGKELSTVESVKEWWKRYERTAEEWEKKKLGGLCELVGEDELMARIRGRHKQWLVDWKMEVLGLERKEVNRNGEQVFMFEDDEAGRQLICGMQLKMLKRKGVEAFKFLREWSGKEGKEDPDVVVLTKVYSASEMEGHEGPTGDGSLENAEKEEEVDKDEKEESEDERSQMGGIGTPEENKEQETTTTTKEMDNDEKKEEDDERSKMGGKGNPEDKKEEETMRTVKEMDDEEDPGKKKKQETKRTIQGTGIVTPVSLKAERQVEAYLTAVRIVYGFYEHKRNEDPWCDLPEEFTEKVCLAMIVLRMHDPWNDGERIEDFVASTERWLPKVFRRCFAENMAAFYDVMMANKDDLKRFIAGFTAMERREFEALLRRRWNEAEAFKKRGDLTENQIGALKAYLEKNNCTTVVSFLTNPNVTVGDIRCVMSEECVPRCVIQNLSTVLNRVERKGPSNRICGPIMSIKWNEELILPELETLTSCVPGRNIFAVRKLIIPMEEADEWICTIVDMNHYIVEIRDCGTTKKVYLEKIFERVESYVNAQFQEIYSVSKDECPNWKRRFTEEKIGEQIDSGVRCISAMQWGMTGERMSCDVREMRLRIAYKITQGKLVDTMVPPRKRMGGEGGVGVSKRLCFEDEK